MARKIVSTIDGPLVLGESDNPLIVTSTGTITSTGAADGIDGAASTAWSITNKGAVSSAGGWGINLAGAGAVANSGMISGLFGGIEIAGPGMVTNRGTITGSTGIKLDAGGFVVNKAGGSVQGSGKESAIGIEIGGPGIVTNEGSIDAPSWAILIEGVGTITNKGTIGAGSEGVAVTLEAGSLENSKGSLIHGGGVDGLGVLVSSGPGRITNAGTITGGVAPGLGVWISSGLGTVTNVGTISAFTGVRLDAGGNVTNSKGGSIDGSVGIGFGIGIEIMWGTGTITNAGTISGGRQSVLFGAGSMNDLLVIKPGAVFNGPADATAATNSTIELTKGVGAIAGIGTGQFVGFDTVEVDGGAKWTLNGPNAIGTMLNDGRLEVAGRLTVSDSVNPNSTGVFQLAPASTLEIAAALGTNSKISFGTGSELVIDHFTTFGRNVGASDYTGSLLKDFGSSTIDLKDFDLTGLHETFSASSGLLQLTNSASQTATLDFQTSSLSAGRFHFASDGASGILITHS
jgi:hypothetical protein